MLTMKTTDYIKTELGMCKNWVMGLAGDMADAPLTFPTPNGGNHPMWVMGHMAYSESNLLHVFILNDENPLADWKDLFGQGSQLTDDATAYPSYDEVIAKFESVRAETLAYLDSITDEDLDKPSHAPEEYKDFFGTIGQVFAMMSIHLSFHGGQVADARRAAKREVLMA